MGRFDEFLDTVETDKKALIVSVARDMTALWYVVTAPPGVCEAQMYYESPKAIEVFAKNNNLKIEWLGDKDRNPWKTS